MASRRRYVCSVDFGSTTAVPSCVRAGCDRRYRRRAARAEMKSKRSPLATAARFQRSASPPSSESPSPRTLVHGKTPAEPAHSKWSRSSKGAGCQEKQIPPASGENFSLDIPSHRTFSPFPPTLSPHNCRKEMSPHRLRGADEHVGRRMKMPLRRDRHGDGVRFYPGFGLVVPAADLYGVLVGLAQVIEVTDPDTVLPVLARF